MQWKKVWLSHSKCPYKFKMVYNSSFYWNDFELFWKDNQDPIWNRLSTVERKLQNLHKSGFITDYIFPKELLENLTFFVVFCISKLEFKKKIKQIRQTNLNVCKFFHFSQQTAESFFQTNIVSDSLWWWFPSIDRKHRHRAQIPMILRTPHVRLRRRRQIAYRCITYRCAFVGKTALSAHNNCFCSMNRVLRRVLPMLSTGW